MKTTRFNRFSSIFCLSVCIGTALPGYSQVDRNETLVRSALRGLEYEIKQDSTSAARHRCPCLWKSVR